MNNFTPENQPCPSPHNENTTPEQRPPPNKTRLPKGVANAFGFSFFNALAFQIMMGPPVIIFAKSLGAGSAILGIIAAFTPLMTILQLPAANYLHKYGYQKFVLLGWGTRTIFIFFIALIPLLASLSNFSKLLLLLLSLFGFNFLRGIASTAWLPWLSALIPHHQRGKFLSLDQIFLHAGCLLSLLLSAQLLGSEGDPAEYSFIFLFSAISQLVSLWFISQIPDVRTGDVAARSAEPVPWKQMLNYTPFRNLLLFNLAFAIATGGLGVFAVEFLREAFLLGPDKVMLLSSVGYVAAMILLPVFGPICDKIGSRPMLLVGTLALSFCSLGYFSFACFHLPNLLWLVGAINFLWGATGSNFNVAMVRASMLVIPEMGRNHFFALYTVLSSLAFGVSPIFWGLALDFAGSHLSSIGVPIHRHTFFFVAASICTLLCLPLLPKISEKLPQKKDNIIR